MNDVRVRFCPLPTGNPTWAWCTWRCSTGPMPDTHGMPVRVPHRGHRLGARPLMRATRHWSTPAWLHLTGTKGPRWADRRAVPAVPAARPVRALRPRLLDEGKAYHCYCTPEGTGSPAGPGHARRTGPWATRAPSEPDPEQIAAYEAEGRSSVVRVRMPDHEWQWNDLVPRRHHHRC